MLLERYLSADISLFLLFVLLMITVIQHKRNAAHSYQSKLFLGICYSTIAMLVLDVLFRFTNGGNNKGVIHIVTFLYFLVEPIPMIFWLCYLDFFLHKSLGRLKKRYFYMPPFSLIVVLMALNPFTHWIFYIDVNNFYQRGPFLLIIVFFNIIILLITLITAIRRKRDVERRAFISLVMFGVIPLIANLLQFLFVGTILIWPSVALSVIYVFVFLEFERDQKDYLTGLLNRQQIDDFILNRISTIGKKGGFTLIMIDMDDFKDINDSFGHKEGDRALMNAAQLIFRSVRSIDKVARFGGDEFIILLEENDPGEVENVIRRIDQKVNVVNDSGVFPYNLSMSCGYRLVQPGEEHSLYNLIHQADLEMYRIKNRKKRGTVSE